MDTSAQRGLREQVRCILACAGFDLRWRPWKLGLIVILGSCNGASVHDTIELGNGILHTDTVLEEKIRQGVTSGQGMLDLSTIVDLKWDSLLMVTPYSNMDNIQEHLGIDLSQSEHVNIESRDDINLLIFYKNGAPTRMVEYPRNAGDFASNAIEFIERDSAIFDIVGTQRNTIGGEWIQLKKQR